MPNIHGVNAWRLLAYLKRLSRRDLEHTVWKVLNSIGFDIEEDRIEVCHWLTKSDRTIVKFSRSKDCQHLMRSKKGQKNLNLTSLNFPEGIKTYVNDSLCPCYSWLWNEFRNFGIIREFIRTLLSMVQLGLNGLKMVHIKASHVSTIWGLSISWGENFHVFSCLGIYKLFCSFPIYVHLVFF